MPFAHDSLTTSSPSVLHAGREAFGRYRLEQLVGRGGMGVVWRALDTKLDRSVALKFLPDVLFLDASARDDLKRETRRCLDLTHPHIVRIHDFIEDEEMAAIVMEYVDGATLSQLRVQRPSRHFEVDDLGTWTTALCAALDYAHEAGLCVHRDLKPGNLMVNGRGILKVTDFGIACSLQNTAARVSAWSSTGGTLGYMSPQQLLGELAAPSDDIYSVGATLYELLTGKPPFFGGDLALQIREIVPDLLTERRRKLGLPSTHVPPAWEQTIAACLAKHPHDRPATAGEIAHRLGLNTAARAEIGPALGETLSPTICTPAQAKPVSLRERWWPHLLTYSEPLVRHRWPVGMAFALLAAVVPWVVKSHPSPTTPVANTAAIAPVVPAPAPVIQQAAPALSVPLPPPAPPPAAPLDGDHLALLAPTPATPPSATISTPAAESPAPSAEATNQVRLETLPAGVPFQIFAGAYETPIAEVVASGETPMDVALPPGGYRVVFAPPGMASRTASVQVSAGNKTVFQQTFPHGTLKVRTQPEHAEVFCDDRDLGPAPLQAELLPGHHEIEASWNGRDARPRSVQLADAAEQTINFDFRTGSSPARSHHPKKKEDDSMLTKIGRTFKNIFGGEKPKKPQQ